MATRGQIIVIEDSISLKKDEGYLKDKFIHEDTLNRYAYLNMYVHFDSYPEGLGETLKKFVTSDVGQGRMEDIEYFSASLITFVCNRNRQEMIDKTDNTGFGIAKQIHGDIEYLYLIDMNTRTLTCYSWDFDGWLAQDKNIVFTLPF